MLGIEILLKNYPTTASLNAYPNIAIFYSRFFASKKTEDYNGSLEYKRDIEELLESGKLKKAVFT